jgi:membrane fusion protein, multidrug efflux system
MTSDNTGKKKIMPFVLGGVLLVAGYFGFQEIRYLMGNEDTENSQLESNIVPVLPKVGGWVTEVLVKDNQRVKAGDTLAKIDDRELKLKVQQAEVALKNAEANVSLIAANAATVGANVGTSNASIALQNAGIEAATANVATVTANIESAKIRVWKATQDFNRYAQLLKEKSTTQQQFDGAKAEKESAEAALAVVQTQVEAAQKTVETARKQVGVGSSQKAAAQSQVGSAQQQINVARLQVDARRAELELTKLQLSYISVTAPLNGQVSRKNVQIGQLVNAGQPLMSIVDDGSVWVIANFKETQIGKMQIGQKVRLKVDAYKNREFEGTIESFAGATGAKFSLLPPDNSTGNFVKVVQRVPTKILITEKNAQETPLRAGMSVSVIVPVN